jgi:hypothetical protein
MKDLQRLADIYNERQDEYKVKSINAQNSGLVVFEYGRYIGFYEFIFNPKYGVFEMFDIYENGLFDYNGFSHKLFNVKQPLEIVKYILKERDNE